MMRLAERVDLSLENHVPVVIQMFIDGFEPTESTRSVWAVVVRVPSFPAAVSMRACELSTRLHIRGERRPNSRNRAQIVSVFVRASRDDSPFSNLSPDSVVSSLGALHTRRFVFCASDILRREAVHRQFELV